MDKTHNHQSCLYTKNDDLEFLIEKFIADHSIDEIIYDSKIIYYINDSSLDFAISMNPEQFNVILLLVINNVPQHHYFFDVDKKWCFVISSEGYIDFGFSN
ncbi:type IV secretion protein Rhs [Photorhabdus sp. SF281]|uniref:type IV secretion protein Rhs n=1 Tax=Photorhabdus sp. SF281 TaxID=3459527 RepID=UPI004045034A